MRTKRPLRDDRSCRGRSRGYRGHPLGARGQLHLPAPRRARCSLPRKAWGGRHARPGAGSRSSLPTTSLRGIAATTPLTELAQPACLFHDRVHQVDPRGSPHARVRATAVIVLDVDPLQGDQRRPRPPHRRPMLLHELGTPAQRHPAARRRLRGTPSGGDEWFAILLPGIEGEMDAFAAAEKIRRRAGPSRSPSGISTSRWRRAPAHRGLPRPRARTRRTLLQARRRGDVQRQALPVRPASLYAEERRHEFSPQPPPPRAGPCAAASPAGPRWRLHYQPQDPDSPTTRVVGRGGAGHRWEPPRARGPHSPGQLHPARRAHGP